MSRQPSPVVAQRNAALVQRIRELKAEHPFWGYRRV
jgi:putative transposase